MIYAGLIHFNDTPSIADKLCPVLTDYSETPPVFLQKKSMAFCYAKLSDLQDKDEVLENETSLMLGRVFDNTTATSLRKKDFENLSFTSPKEIFKSLWGKYVYIRSVTGYFEIIVDPTGQLPFFYYVFPNGNVLFASDIEIIFKILERTPQYNWSYLCSYLVYGNSSAIQTPFEEIYELPPACSLKITKNDRVTEPFWNPLDACSSTSPENTNAVNVLQSVLKPWIEPYTNICVSLSGGLDSSSLVYCLKDILKKDQKLIAVNYFHSKVKSSNELVHARKVCQETGIDLIEADASSCLPFDSSTHKRSLLPNKPYPGLMSLKWIETVSECLPSDKACTFLSGHGSDHIFMRPPAKQTISDYIIDKGFRGVPLKDITAFYRDSLFPILKENITALGGYILGWRRDKRHPKNVSDERPDWIKKELGEKASVNFIHPIYRTLLPKILPGKYAQIDAFYEGLASIHMEANPILPTYYPYLYKPVVDFAFSFPTYDLFKEGHDRYPLRKSVSDHFNTQTVWRRDKSQTTGILQLGMKKNLDFILTLCGEGKFVKQGLIDKEGMQETINLISNGDINYMWPFTHLASAELFLDAWKKKF
jgi:asparagine synthase (glutamine-hydrolysing)